MIIIYNCYGGTHSSILASAVHLNKLPSDRIPTRKEILEIEFFNTLTYKDMGKLIFHGQDEDGNLVYTIGRGTSKVLIPAMQNLIADLHRRKELNENFIFVNCSPTVPASMTLGGFFSRALGIHVIGVPLLILGARRTHYNVVKLVQKTKEAIRQKPEGCCIMDIDEKGRLNIIS